MQYIVLLLNISNRKIKWRFKSIDTVAGNFARCQRNYWCMHAPLDFLHLQQVVHGLGFHPHHAVTASSRSACGQFQTSVWKRRQWWEFGNKTIIFHHPSLGFSPGGDFRCCNLTCHRLVAPVVFQCVHIIQINTGSSLEHHWVLASASVVPVASQCTCGSSGLPVWSVQWYPSVLTESDLEVIRSGHFPACDLLCIQLVWWELFELNWFILLAIPNTQKTIMVLISKACTE